MVAKRKDLVVVEGSLPELCSWNKYQRSLKNRVSRKMIALKAKELFDNGDFESTKETFKVNSDWLQNFMKRHDMVVSIWL